MKNVVSLVIAVVALVLGWRLFDYLEKRNPEPVITYPAQPAAIVEPVQMDTAQAVNANIDAMNTQAAATVYVMQTAIAPAPPVIAPTSTYEPTTAPQSGPTDLKTCMDAVVYSAPIADPSRTVAIIPAGSTMPAEARQGMDWVKIYVPGAATEWWMNAAAFCFE